jgi:hypothetical protein
MSTQPLLVRNVDGIRSYTQVEIENNVRSYAEVMDALNSEDMERCSIHSFFLSFFPFFRFCLVLIYKYFAALDLCFSLHRFVPTGWEM